MNSTGWGRLVPSGNGCGRGLFALPRRRSSVRTRCSAPNRPDSAGLAGPGFSMGVAFRSDALGSPTEAVCRVQTGGCRRRTDGPRLAWNKDGTFLRTPRGISWVSVTSLASFVAFVSFDAYTSFVDWRRNMLVLKPASPESALAQQAAQAARALSAVARKRKPSTKRVALQAK